MPPGKSPIQTADQPTGPIIETKPINAAEPSVSDAQTRETVSFTPAFLSRRSPSAPTDPVDNAEPFSKIICSPRSNVHSPPARKRKAGKLVKRLQSLRDAIKGDSIRFQSGQYPFKGSFDTNDPRYRAKSYMDVTILQNSVSWEKECQRLTVLGHIHAHTSTTNDTSILVGSKSLVWLCFSYATAREQNLGLWSQLRIYNAVVLPVNEAITADDEPSVSWMVVCTQLCERYPAVLPALPSTFEIAEHVGRRSQTQEGLFPEKGVNNVS